jgi:hypothetical protein
MSRRGTYENNMNHRELQLRGTDIPAALKSTHKSKHSLYKSHIYPQKRDKHQRHGLIVHKMAYPTHFPFLDLGSKGEDI